MNKLKAHRHLVRAQELLQFGTAFGVRDKHIVGMIVDHIYHGYKSSVGVVDRSQLAAELQNMDNCSRTFLVHFGKRIKHMACLFVSACKLY